jgi:glycerate 2-kinase
MLSQIARKIFQETLLRIDAREAVRRAVKIDGSKLTIKDESIEIDLLNTPVYVFAIGKAAYPMTIGFNEVAGKWIKGGVVSGVISKIDESDIPLLDSRWKIFGGGHPLPNEESLAAARACLKLLEEADSERALVIFLISGGGSAMMELARDPEISLSDLRALNQLLVTSGAAITEINSVRRAVSDIKGGGLALRCPHTTQISLIISDTAPGDISSVASGPSLLPDKYIPQPWSVVEKYNLTSQLPAKVVKALKKHRAEYAESPLDSRIHVLLDNDYMIRQAAEIAEKMGFIVKIDNDADDSFIVEGCELLLSRFMDFRQSVLSSSPICFVSGGEFGCTVKGSGIGGRNSETVLRMALLAQQKKMPSEYAILSAGTDGIDGNSAAAGSVTDQTIFERALSRKMNPLEYLEMSDSFSFFNELGDAIITGATGTNVRDIRLLIAK